MKSNAPRVALVSGFWGQNIGNAFFNIGGKWILDHVFGAGNVGFIQDQPGYRTFNNQQKGNPPNDIELLRYLDVDYLVLQGPLLTESLPALWRRALAQLFRRGGRLILLGAAFFRYSEREIYVAREFLHEFRPTIIITRDQRSYDIVKDWADYTYSGIDSGFFVNDAYDPFWLGIEPYVTVGFDRYPEPDFKIIEAGPDRGFSCCFEFHGQLWSWHFPSMQQWFSRRGKWQAYVGALLDRRRLPSRLGPYLVLRPEHRFNPHVTWKIYRQPNAVASDEPFTYFNVYARTVLTLSDRVHACVATLAYGNPAMLFTPSPRSSLFDRLGLSEIRRRPVVLDPVYLQFEKDRQIEFLRAAIGPHPDIDARPSIELENSNDHVC